MGEPVLTETLTAPCALDWGLAQNTPAAAIATAATRRFFLDFTKPPQKPIAAWYHKFGGAKENLRVSRLARPPKFSVRRRGMPWFNLGTAKQSSIWGEQCF